MFAVIVWALFGYVAGCIALHFFPAPRPVSALQTMAIGVGGSMIGGVTAAIVSGSPYSPAGFFVSALGAVIVISVWRRYEESK